MAIKIKGKIWAVGNSYVITVPKSLIESGNFDIGEEVVAQLEPFQDTNGTGRIRTSLFDVWRNLTPFCAFNGVSCVGHEVFSEKTALPL